MDRSGPAENSPENSAGGEAFFGAGPRDTTLSGSEALICALADGRILFWNAGARALFGYSEAAILWRSISTLVPERFRETWSSFLAALDPGGEGPAVARTIHGPGLRKDGSEFPIELTLTAWRVEGGRILSGVVRDVSARRAVREALRASEERFALAARGANDGLWEWDLGVGRASYSPRWKAILGHAEEEVGHEPREWLDRVHPEDLPRVEADLQAHLEGVTDHFENEHRLRHRDGSYRWVLCRGVAVRDEDGAVSRMAGSLTDIGGRREVERQLASQAFDDRLTGLPNRALFMELLERAFGHAQRRPNYLFAVLLLDVDRFERVNDSLGHAVGDELLAAFARRLELCLRPGDSVARFDGDKFAILLDDIRDAEDAIGVAGRIRRKLALPFAVGGHEVFAGASIGIAFGSLEVEKADDLVRDADIALHRAKALGQGRHEVFDTGMRAHAVTLLRLETDLRRALDRRELRIHYQPIVSLTTGAIAGFEALLRWQHPERGLMPPADFIPLAEETGLVVPMDRWVLREACERMRSWREGGQENGLSITVNLSSRQFVQPDLVDYVTRTLRDTELPPSALRLEITESALMEGANSVTATLAELRELGIRLSLDDFGTGYSSLSYLHSFPIDILKIDRSFVSRMGAHGEPLAIVRAIVALAGGLGLEVVAEGVETADQLAGLRRLDCAMAQGYYFSPPVNEAAATTLVSSLGLRATGNGAAGTASSSEPRSTASPS